MKFSSISLSLLIALAPKSTAYTRFSDTNSRQAIVVDMDSNRIVYEKNSMTPTAMASLSKMMTLLVTFDALKTRKVSLNDQVGIIASDVNREGTNMKLNDGDVISLDVLLDSMMIISANDSALAVARHVGGDYQTFVEMMNSKAGEIGMENTKFYNPNGLPIFVEKDGQTVTYENTTTARDVMLLSKYLYENYERELTRITSKRRFVNTIKQIDEENTNPILSLLKEADGLKTGFTDKAGYCLAYSVKINRDANNEIDNRLIGVSMGAPSKEARRDAAFNTMSFIKSRYKTKRLYSDSDVIASKDINGIINMKLSPDKNVSIIKKDEEVFKTRIVYKRVNIIKNPQEPIAEWELVDQWGNVATSVDLHPSTPLYKAGFIHRMYYTGLALIGDLLGTTKSDKPNYPVYTIFNGR